MGSGASSGAADRRGRSGSLSLRYEGRLELGTGWRDQDSLCTRADVGRDLPLRVSGRSAEPRSSLAARVERNDRSACVGRAQ